MATVANGGAGKRRAMKNRPDITGEKGRGSIADSESAVVNVNMYSFIYFKYFKDIYTWALTEIDDQIRVGGTTVEIRRPYKYNRP